MSPMGVAITSLPCSVAFSSGTPEVGAAVPAAGAPAVPEPADFSVLHAARAAPPATTAAAVATPPPMKRRRDGFVWLDGFAWLDGSVWGSSGTAKPFVAVRP